MKHSFVAPNLNAVQFILFHKLKYPSEIMSLPSYFKLDVKDGDWW